MRRLQHQVSVHLSGHYKLPDRQTAEEKRARETRKRNALLETRCSKRAARNALLETRCSKRAARNALLETRCSKHATRNTTLSQRLLFTQPSPFVHIAFPLCSHSCVAGDHERPSGHVGRVRAHSAGLHHAPGRDRGAHELHSDELVLDQRVRNGVVGSRGACVRRDSSLCTRHSCCPTCFSVVDNYR